MILAIDSGNTRIKWGLGELRASAGAVEWRRIATATLAEASRLREEWAALARPEKVVIANVAGEAARAPLEQALAPWAVAAQWITAQESQCGVTNGYLQPSQLGCDRWAALIGAWHLHRGASLVVTAGTATTVDMLGSTGVFRGGIILPGLELMKKSLAENTAGLPLAKGEYAEEPRSTQDAIESGCLHAQAGAIERMYSRLEPGAVCFLSGGAALRIAGRLDLPVRVVDNLTLEGLMRIAQ